jgi:hypothetical protein
MYGWAIPAIQAFRGPFGIGCAAEDIPGLGARLPFQQRIKSAADVGAFLAAAG